MKVDGRAWLVLEVNDNGSGSTYIQRAIYQPTGLPGRLYWWSLIPFHALIFPLMLRNILKKAKQTATSSDDDTHTQK